MKAIKPILTIIACCFVLNGTAQKTIDTIATKVGSYDIPIKIQLPKKSIEKSPIFFFVHGGGWNGGTQNEVPPATISGDANFLVNELGIIYVGLAYRCKGNNATFADAINDLESSVNGILIESDSLYNGRITVLTMDFWFTGDWILEWSKKRTVGCGLTYYNKWLEVFFSGEVLEENIALVYYRKGDEEWGEEQLIVSIPEIICLK